MALSASTVWEVRTTGADTNGGGFVTGASGSDFSQQAAAQFALTTVTTAAANAICLSASAAATMVGNICQIVSGTNFTAGFYQILSVVAGVSFTLDRTCTTAAGSNGVINIGGAILSPAIAAAAAIGGNRVYIKSGAYSITGASTNVAGGCPSFTTNLAVEGYNSSRGDFGTAPVLTASGISTAALLAAAADSSLRNISVNGASLTAIRGISITRGTNYKLTAINCTNSGIFGAGGACISCSVTGCTTAGFAFNGITMCIDCEAYSNTVGGFSGPWSVNCLSYNNSGASSDGFTYTAQNSGQVNCVSYNNGRDGFRNTVGSGGVVSFYQNCIAEGNAGWGFNPTSSTYLNLNTCAAYNNTLGNVSTPAINLGMSVGFVTGLSSFFVNAASGNFALNNTASAGASARATGSPGIFPSTLTTGYLDIGAAQHADPVKLLTVAGMTGGME